MSSDPTTQTSREVIAQSAVKRAMEGNLPFLSSHSIELPKSSESYRTTLPKPFFENTPYEAGDQAGAFVDFENGIVVLDFQEGESYER